MKLSEDAKEAIAQSFEQLAEMVREEKVSYEPAYMMGDAILASKFGISSAGVQIEANVYAGVEHMSMEDMAEVFSHAAQLDIDNAFGAEEQKNLWDEWRKFKGGGSP